MRKFPCLYTPHWQALRCLWTSKRTVHRETSAVKTTNYNGNSKWALRSLSTEWLSVTFVITFTSEILTSSINSICSAQFIARTQSRCLKWQNQTHSPQKDRSRYTTLYCSGVCQRLKGWTPSACLWNEFNLPYYCLHQIHRQCVSSVYQC